VWNSILAGVVFQHSCVACLRRIFPPPLSGKKPVTNLIQCVCRVFFEECCLPTSPVVPHRAR
jgi:hypothetical protein